MFWMEKRPLIWSFRLNYYWCGRSFGGFLSSFVEFVIYRASSGFLLIFKVIEKSWEGLWKKLCVDDRQMALGFYEKFSEWLKRDLCSILRCLSLMLCVLLCQVFLGTDRKRRQADVKHHTKMPQPWRDFSNNFLSSFKLCVLQSNVF
jgi:hypothetical protein